MVTTPQEQEAKKSKKAQVLVDLNAVETSFEKWAKPGHFSRTLAKGPKTTTWIWNLHADAHDFDMQSKSLELYVHNDVVVAFGQPEKQILIEPIFAQWIQAASGKSIYGFDNLLSSATNSASVASQNLWLPNWLEAINSNKNSLFFNYRARLLSCSSCNCFRLTYYNTYSY